MSILLRFLSLLTSTMNRPLIQKIIILLAVVAVLLVGVRMLKGKAATLPAAS